MMFGIPIQDLLAGSVVFLIGASIGSFLNVVADRLPAGESLLEPPSHCPHCNRRLTPLELIPVFSYLALRGRCVQCQSGIPLRVMLVEMIMGLLAVYVWSALGTTVVGVVVFGLSMLFMLLALIDLEHGIVPDIVVYPGIVAALLLAPWWNEIGIARTFLGSSSPWYLLLGSVAGAAIGAGLFAAIILLRPGSMGWGDVTMAALLGLVNGMPGTFVVLFMAIISGGIIGAGLLLMGKRGRKQSIPFGPFLALGGVASLLWGGSIWTWYRGFS